MERRDVLHSDILRVLFLLLLALMVVQLPCVTYASTLALDLSTSLSSYNLGSLVTVGGNVTLDGVAVSDAFVTFEVRDSRSQMLSVRTCPTGTGPPGPWFVEIVDFYPCDQAGNMRESINAGGYLGFKMTIRNNAATSLHVTATVSMQWSDSVPFVAFAMYNADLEAESEETFFTWGLELPTDAPLGVASLYASVLTGLPSASWGYAYSPETVADLLITECTRTMQAAVDSLPFAINDSACSISFATSVHGGALGQYKVYGSAICGTQTSTATARFSVRLVTDITGLGGTPDGKVDVMDLALVSGVFGTYPDHPDWKPQADVNNDGKVDIRDVAMVSGDFGKYGILP